VELDVKTSPDILVDALLWSAVSEDDRDFRDEKWTSVSLNAKGNADVTASIDLPEKGYKAFYIDLKYLDPNGNEYTISTRMFVTDTQKIL
jgi:PhoPQ-activated pathogenicity-related protein